MSTPVAIAENNSTTLNTNRNQAFNSGNSSPEPHGAEEVESTGGIDTLPEELLLEIYTLLQEGPGLSKSQRALAATNTRYRNFVWGQWQKNYFSPGSLPIPWPTSPNTPITPPSRFHLLLIRVIQEYVKNATTTGTKWGTVFDKILHSKRIIPVTHTPKGPAFLSEKSLALFPIDWFTSNGGVFFHHMPMDPTPLPEMPPIGYDPYIYPHALASTRFPTNSQDPSLPLNGKAQEEPTSYLDPSPKFFRLSALILLLTETPFKKGLPNPLDLDPFQILQALVIWGDEEAARGKHDPIHELNACAYLALHIGNAVLDPLIIQLDEKRRPLAIADLLLYLINNHKEDTVNSLLQLSEKYLSTEGKLYIYRYCLQKCPELIQKVTDQYKNDKEFSRAIEQPLPLIDFPVPPAQDAPVVDRSAILDALEVAREACLDLIEQGNWEEALKNSSKIRHPGFRGSVVLRICQWLLKNNQEEEAQILSHQIPDDMGHLTAYHIQYAYHLWNKNKPSIRESQKITLELLNKAKKYIKSLPRSTQILCVQFFLYQKILTKDSILQQLFILDLVDNKYSSFFTPFYAILSVLFRDEFPPQQDPTILIKKILSSKTESPSTRSFCLLLAIQELLRKGDWVTAEIYADLEQNSRIQALLLHLIKHKTSLF